MTDLADTAVVVIGRNEGPRLSQSLASLPDGIGAIVYVDSGSTDDSTARAADAGIRTLALDSSLPFTAARGRNAGARALSQEVPPPSFIQFLDGDCLLCPGWLEKARDFLLATPEAGVACGRLREEFPEASLYNRLLDAEWNTPLGKAKACGGIALIRLSAFDAVNGFDPTLIAGEEPEFSVRLRQAGWTIWRLDVDMALHDAAIKHFSQWWQRVRRGGYACAQGVAMHGAAPERHMVRPLFSALFWGAGPPLLAVFSGLALGKWGLLALAIWPAQVLRLRQRGMSIQGAVFVVLTKVAECQGIADWLWERLGHRRRTVSDYTRDDDSSVMPR